MMYGNSGYVGQSMSVRAARAKDNNEVVLSDINLSLLEDLEINETVVFMKFLMKRLGATSWHHTGKMFNETEFYDLNRYYDLSETELKVFREEYNNTRKPRIRNKKQDFEFAIIDYVEWEGNFKNYKRPVAYLEKCIVVGNWAHLLKGGKKNIKGKHVNDIEYLGKIKPREFNTIVVNRMKKGLNL